MAQTEIDLVGRPKATIFQPPYHYHDSRIYDGNGAVVALLMIADLAGGDERFDYMNLVGEEIAKGMNELNLLKLKHSLAKEMGRHEALLALARELDHDYAGAPFGADNKCVICHVGPKAPHGDNCYDLSAALAEERDGRGWDLYGERD